MSQALPTSPFFRLRFFATVWFCCVDLGAVRPLRQVNGQKRSFLAAEVMPRAIGDGIELEFACRCRLRRRRCRRRSSVLAATTTSAGDFTPGTSTSTAVIVDDPEREGSLTEEDGDEEDEEFREEEPDVTAKVRIFAPDGELLGEAWAELPGAPDDWARYPLYSPGVAAGARNLGSGADATSVMNPRADSVAPATSKGTGLDRGEVIPAAPATVRRRWGWGMPRREVSTSSSSTVRPARWFRPRQPRDVAGEVRLCLGWLPSGLAVTVHRCRRWGGSVAEPVSAGGGVRGLSERPLDASPRRRLIAVRAEPGGGAVRLHPVEIDARSGDEKQQCDTVAMDVGVSPEASRAGGIPPRMPGRGRLPSLRRVVPIDQVPVTADVEESLETFFALDPSCLLGGVDMGDAVTGADDIGGGGGGGARLILSMLGQSSSSGSVDADCGVEVDEGVQEGTATGCPEGLEAGKEEGGEGGGGGEGAGDGWRGRGVGGGGGGGGGGGAGRRGGGESAGGGGSEGEEWSSSLARAELLLFPGADPARRWVKLTDAAGNTTGEVDITVAWSVAPPRRPIPSDGGSDRGTIEKGIVSSPNREASAKAGSSVGVRERTLEDGQAALLVADSLEAGVTLSTEKTSDTDGRMRVEDAGGGGSEAGVGEADDAGRGGDQMVPEPVQVVSRCFSVHASDLVLGVSDLDVAVLVTMAKGIVRVRVGLCGGIKW